VIGFVHLPDAGSGEHPNALLKIEDCACADTVKLLLARYTAPIIEVAKRSINVNALEFCMEDVGTSKLI
jgi:hypothetical protein